MNAKTALGDYLRARRQLVTPEAVGLPRGTRRRVPGLRREELALLAGISPDYYLRLEQGRDHNPSAPVLDALAEVLLLDTEAKSYLYQLAGIAPTEPPQPEKEEAPAGIAELLDEFPVPAFVQGRYLDVLAANAAARALSPQYRPGINLLRAAFLDPRDRELHQDWDRATREAVSGLRASVGLDLEDPRLKELVSELASQSARFRELWERQDTRAKVGGTSRMMHPVVGPLVLRHEKFAVTGAKGQIMVVYHAEPGSPSQAALRLLAGGAPQDSADSAEAIQSSEPNTS